MRAHFHLYFFFAAALTGESEREEDHVGLREKYDRPRLQKHQTPSAASLTLQPSPFSCRC
jgi:hypothetical protein